MAVNYVDCAVVTATSQQTGALSKPQKEGAGAANAVLSGVYTGVDNKDYYVVIESTGEIGAATFKWSDNGGSTFNATGVATSTSPVTLNNGVQIRWTSGAGNDVVIADNWRWKAYLPYHRLKSDDRERDTEWRSSGTTLEALSFDLIEAQEPQALVLLDHNLTESATVTLQGSSDAFATTPVNYTIPWNSGSILYFLGTDQPTLRYWRVLLSDAANTDGFIRISEVFLGPYVRLDHTFTLGDYRGKQRAGQRDRNLSGRFYGAVNAVLHTFDISWVRLSQTDRDKLVGVFDALNDLLNRQVLPVFFSPMDTDLTQIYLCEWSDQQIMPQSEADVPEKYTVPVRLIEQPRTLATS